MKNFPALLMLVCCVTSLQARQTKILWIGNSYTYVNDLPTMFYNLALSGGDTVVFDSHTIGGYTLQQHSQDTITQAKIKSQQWDYVVIQAQSQEPSFPTSQFNSATLPYAIILDSLVRANNSCSKTVWYMTWGKKYGDASNCASFPVLCTFDGVTSQLRIGYQTMADTTNSLMAPVGMAWQARWHTDTLINMWQSDNSHPTVEGTYLNACVIYATIFRKSPIGLSFSAVSPQSVTDTLQSVASRTVLDSLATWHIGIYDPRPAFTYSVDTSTKTIQLAPTGSANYTNTLWNFGDGTVSANATHTYADSGTYTVMLTVTDNCSGKDSVQQSITTRDTIATLDTTHTGIAVMTNNDLNISPNPVKDILNITTSQPLENGIIEIWSTIGRREMVLPHNTEINVSSLPNGIYLLKADGKVKRFIKLL